MQKESCSSYRVFCKNKWLLIIRLGVGTLMAIHGAWLVFGWSAMWQLIGWMVSSNPSVSSVAGLLAGLIMFVGWIAFVLWIAFRLSAALLSFTMLVAALSHFFQWQGLYELGGPWHAVDLAVVFLGLVFTGPGRYVLCCRKCCSSSCSDAKKMDSSCCGWTCHDKTGHAC